MAEQSTRHQELENVSEAELVERLTNLTPLLTEHAREAEQQRKPVDSVMAAIEATGAYRYFVPKRYGGFEYSLTSFMEIGMALGRGCVSTAWVTTFCMEHNWLLGLFGEEAQDAIFGKQPYIIAPGALAPNGKATPVDGGYRVTGRWQWGTGIMHADWAMFGALAPLNDGSMTLKMFIAPKSDVDVIDTWHIDGMVGTGSNDIAVNDLFVPGHLCVDIAQLRDGNSPGARLHDSATFKMPMLPVLGLTAAAPAVGATLEAVDLFAQRMEGRTVYGTTSKQSDKPIAQSRLAQARIASEAARQRLLALANEVSAYGDAGQPCIDLDRARLRLSIAMLVRDCRDIVRGVVEASGASGHFLHHPMQRIARDLNTLSCHTVFDVDLGSEMYGRLLLGLEPNGPV
ncbi:MAG: acyl-CoA dehydrogenase family protein [Pseudomonadaceae bacterium]|nr:acyl-CoA dehydrogenase family protein [Pseudomonadaceae bacterium]